MQEEQSGPSFKTYFFKAIHKTFGMYLTMSIRVMLTPTRHEPLSHHVTMQVHGDMRNQELNYQHNIYIYNYIYIPTNIHNYIIYMYTNILINIYENS